MANTKYRLSAGVGVSPEREINLLEQMSRKGWHLTGMRGLFYRFERGTPHEYDYAVNTEVHINSEMMSFYEASGWTPIVTGNGIQVFRAEAGATPIFSDSESEIELLSKNRKLSGKLSLVALSLLIVWLILTNTMELNRIVSNGLGLLTYSFFVFTFLPFVGFSVSINKRRKASSLK